MRRASSLLLAAAWCAVAAVPSPESFFGHRMGADRKLVTWDRVVAYFEGLPKETDRMRVERIGSSVDGKPMIAAFIAAPDTIRNLDRYREIQSRLADPRRTSEAEAEKLIAEGKTVVVITCSVHSTEVASTMTAIEYAYRLLTEDTPKRRAILANTIFILVPSLNPDGIDIVANWYAKTLGTPFEGTSPPELYQRYIGHDNNRDWYIFSQPETRNTIARLHNVWRPQIVYDVHQQGAYASRMFVPPWMDPIEPNIDANIAQLCNAIGAAMASDLTLSGRKGVVINAIYDFWTPARHYQAYHGGLRILSESASARLATPVKVEANEVGRSAQGYNPRERSWNHLEPWLGGEWRVRDIVDDQIITFESCLYQAAVRREDLLRSFWNIGRRAVRREEPYAFVVPGKQFDPGSARRMLETLAFGDVEIESARRAFTAGGREYPAGSYVIRMQQPYSSWAKTLLERQNYPDLRLYPGGPPKRPYDVTAHTLPLLMGVEVAAVQERFEADLQRAAKFPFAAGDGDVDAYRRGSKTRRIGLYRSWMPNMDEGWTRWLLDTFGYKYSRVTNADLHAGDLRRRFDVLVFPDQRSAAMHNGYSVGAMPPEYTGGIGDTGAAALRQFASEGGTIVLLNDATAYAKDHLGIDVKNVVAGLGNNEFYSPGSILRARLDTSHPLAPRLPEELFLWSEHSPAFEVPAGARAVVTYPDKDLLASGWLLGEKYLHRRAALLDVPVGSGHVLLFGMRPQYRAQSYLTFKLFFNALNYGK